MYQRRRLVTAVTATAGIAAAIVLGTAAAASAHIEATATDTAADSYTTLTFSVPHGCDGSPTTALTFHVPSSVIEVTPTVNPNWTISKATEPYTSASSAADSENPEDAGTRVTSVTYTATTPLPADERDTFQLSLSLPDGKAGDVVAFPVTQTCEQGSTAWDQVQEAGQDEPEHPAPSVTLTAAIPGADDDDDHAAAHATAAAAATDTTSTGAPDNVARGLGIAGLVVGAVGVVSAVATARKRTR
ncbi:YcnI family protein [Curtobacterium sp. RRHDQ10]|uniref:YcnI family copper-binding membrane protein n=1 Tax=Curtobacterium phyllosphaerae TaxID=3413379 RepID=UPI003BF2CD23